MRKDMSDYEDDGTDGEVLTQVEVKSIIINDFFHNLIGRKEGRKEGRDEGRKEGRFSLKIFKVTKWKSTLFTTVYPTLLHRYSSLVFSSLLSTSSLHFLFSLLLLLLSSLFFFFSLLFSLFFFFLFFSLLLLLSSKHTRHARHNYSNGQ